MTEQPRKPWEREGFSWDQYGGQSGGINKDTGGGTSGSWTYSEGSNKPQGGWTDYIDPTTAGNRYYVDVPFPFSLIIGKTMMFRSQDEAYAFRDQLLATIDQARDLALPLSFASLFGGAMYMTGKHPKEMQGVLLAFSNTVEGIAKGIGETIPG